MTLQKKELEIIYLTLDETKPNLADARIRDAFLKPLGETLDQLNKDKTAIYLTFCDKNEDDSPLIVDGKYHFQNENLEEINDELKKLVEEEIEISITNPEKIKELIENTIYSPKTGEVEIIDGFIGKL